MDALTDLAALAKVSGLPWAELHARGQGLADSDAYLGYLVAQQTRATAIASQLDITTDEWHHTSVQTVQAAWLEVYRTLSDRAQAVLAAVRAGQLVVAAKSALSIDTDVLRTLVIVINAYASAGMRAHESGMVAWQVQLGDFTVEQAETDASHVYGLWDCIVQLDALGGLDSIRRKPTAGVGAPPLIVAIVVVAVICILAWAILAAREQSLVYDMRRQRCFDEAGRPREPWPSECKKYFDELAAAPYGHLLAALKPVSDVGQSFATSLAWAAAVTGSIYLLAVYGVPRLLRGSGRRRELEA